MLCTLLYSSSRIIFGKHQDFNFFKTNSGFHIDNGSPGFPHPLIFFLPWLVSIYKMGKNYGLTLRLVCVKFPTLLQNQYLLVLVLSLYVHLRHQLWSFNGLLVSFFLALQKPPPPPPPPPPSEKSCMNPCLVFAEPATYDLLLVVHSIVQWLCVA